MQSNVQDKGAGAANSGEGKGHNEIDGDSCVGCLHPAFFMGMCVTCGAAKSEAAVGAGTEDSVALKYIHAGLEVSKSEIERLRKECSDKLASTSKLLLVLDLDHTLLNSSKDEDLVESKEKLEQWSAKDQERGEHQRHLYHMKHMRLWTKLRPLVREFLHEASQLFEMYIYTMGNRDYAMQMASLLDPGRLYFNQRIISQDDSTASTTKSLDIVMGDDTKVVVLDDTEGVWPNHQRNLVRIERYLFFPNAPGHFHLRCPSLMALDVDEDINHGALTRSLHVLREVHRRYFEMPITQRDVRQCIAAVKRTVLEECRIVMSRAFPSDHPLSRLATELGATCHQDKHKDATHVVAGSLGTEKVQWAIKNRILVVQPQWIIASANLWKRADEQNYGVKDSQNHPTLQLVDDAQDALAAAGGG